MNLSSGKRWVIIGTTAAVVGTPLVGALVGAISLPGPSGGLGSAIVVPAADLSITAAPSADSVGSADSPTAPPTGLPSATPTGPAAVPLPPPTGGDDSAWDPAPSADSADGASSAASADSADGASSAASADSPDSVDSAGSAD